MALVVADRDQGPAAATPHGCRKKVGVALHDDPQSGLEPTDVGLGHQGRAVDGDRFG